MTAMTEDVQQQVLDVVRKSQEMTLDAIKQVVETVNAAAGKLPAMPAMPFAGKLPQLPSLPAAAPGAPALPTPETVVSSTFDFLDRLLAEQRKFAGELVKATSGLRPAAKAGEARREGAGGIRPLSRGPPSKGPVRRSLRSRSRQSVARRGRRVAREGQA